MATSEVLTQLKSTIFDMYEETFERVHGYYLDRNTSLFETLETISAEEASRPASPNCTSIAAHVEHVRFYMQVTLDSMQGKAIGKIDWEDSWQLKTVTPEEWESLKARLNEVRQNVLVTMQSFDTWEGENNISDALAVIVHTAYHIGAIRQLLCVLR